MPSLGLRVGSALERRFFQLFKGRGIAAMQFSWPALGCLASIAGPMPTCQREPRVTGGRAAEHPALPLGRPRPSRRVARLHRPAHVRRQHGGRADPQGFRQESEARSKQPPRPPGALPRMTFHGAKGLEPDHACPAGVAEDMLPPFHRAKAGRQSTELEKGTTQLLRRGCAAPEGPDAQPCPAVSGETQAPVALPRGDVPAFDTLSPSATKS